MIFSKPPPEFHSTVCKIPQKKQSVVQVSLLCFCCVSCWSVCGLCWQNWSTPHSKPRAFYWIAFTLFRLVLKQMVRGCRRPVRWQWSRSTQQLGLPEVVESVLGWPVLGRADCIQMLTPHRRPWISCSQIYQRDSWKHRQVPGREADSHDVWSLVSLSWYANGMPEPFESKHILY